MVQEALFYNKLFQKALFHIIRHNIGAYFKQEMFSDDNFVISVIKNLIELEYNFLLSYY